MSFQFVATRHKKTKMCHAHCDDWFCAREWKEKRLLCAKTWQPLQSYFSFICIFGGWHRQSYLCYYCASCSISAWLYRVIQSFIFCPDQWLGFSDEAIGMQFLWISELWVLIICASKNTEDKKHFSTKISGTKFGFLKINGRKISLSQNLLVQLHPLHPYLPDLW